MNRSRKHTTFTALFFPGLILFAAVALNSQQLQRGVSVNLAPTSNAKPAPAADDLNAWVVSVSADGRLWFGTTAFTSDALANKMIQTPRNREQKLYIKADARASYADLMHVLRAAHTVGFESSILLTGQRTSAQPNGLTPPMGLEVWIENGALAGPKPVELEIAANEGQAAVKVDGEQVSWANLQSAIKQLSRNQTDSVVRLKGEGAVPFAQVARAVDASRSAGARVVLVNPKI